MISSEHKKIIKKYKFIIISIIIVFLITPLLVIINQLKKPEIKNFKACAAAGFPLMESYPRRCTTKDGKTFTEILPGNNTSLPPSNVCVNSCGDGTCQEVTCTAVGCPCSENEINCPQDCK